MFFSIFTVVCNHYKNSEHFYQPQKNSVLFSYYLPILLFPISFFYLSPRPPLIFFLFLLICLFWTFHINGIISFVAFSDWLLVWLSMMFSSFIHQFIPFYCWILLYFMAISTFYPSIHQLMGIFNWDEQHCCAICIHIQVSVAFMFSKHFFFNHQGPCLEEVELWVGGRETWIGCLPRFADWGCNPKPGYVLPWLEIKLAIFRCIGECSTNWATPAGLHLYFHFSWVYI